MKRCTKCGLEKPLNEFNKDKSRQSGLHPWCKPCARKRRNDWYEKNREANLAYQAKWRAENPEVKKASDAAWIEKNQERKRQADAAWRDANREKLAAYFKALYHEQKNDPAYREARAQRKAKRRARLAGVEHQPYARLSIYKRDGGICQTCRIELSVDKYEVDHIVPIALGGPDTPANLQLMCGPCNRRKWANLEGQTHFAV